MTKEIKLIWDFRGTEAEAIAKHHAAHLNDYAASHQLPPKPIGAEALTPMHSIAFIVVDESQMITVRDALKPHRGEFVDKQ